MCKQTKKKVVDKNKLQYIFFSFAKGEINKIENINTKVMLLNY